MGEEKQYIVGPVTRKLFLGDTFYFAGSYFGCGYESSWRSARVCFLSTWCDASANMGTGLNRGSSCPRRYCDVADMDINLANIWNNRRRVCVLAAQRTAVAGVIIGRCTLVDSL